VQTVPSLNHGSLEVFPPRYALTGEIWMQGQTARGGISVALSPGSTHAYGPYSAVSLDQSGANLDFGTVVGDSYVLTTNQPRYLNIDAAMDIQVTLGEDTVLPTLKLFGGNAVWTDNVIDISDASVVGAWYEKTLDDLEPEQTLDADINFDGVVNIADLAQVAGNFGLSSESAYQGWLP
jgi:hypothetical protein